MADIEIDRTRWWEHGACRGINPDLFFPERGEPASQAKAVCAECPVVAECLNDALSLDGWYDTGIWGGTSARERRRIRYNRRRGLPDRAGLDPWSRPA